MALESSFRSRGRFIFMSTLAPSSATRSSATPRAVVSSSWASRRGTRISRTRRSAIRLPTTPAERCAVPEPFTFELLIRHRRHHAHSRPPRDYHRLFDYAKRYRRIGSEMKHAILGPKSVQPPELTLEVRGRSRLAVVPLDHRAPRVVNR